MCSASIHHSYPIHLSIHPIIHTFFHTFTHSFIHSHIRSFIHTFKHSYIHCHITHTNRHSSIPINPNWYQFDFNHDWYQFDINYRSIIFIVTKNNYSLHITLPSHYYYNRRAVNPIINVSYLLYQTMCEEFGSGTMMFIGPGHMGGYVNLYSFSAECLCIGALDWWLV